MTVKIVFQTVCHQFPLGDGRDAVGHVLLYLRQQQREVCAAQNDGVYLRVFGQQVADVLAYEVVDASPCASLFSTRDTHRGQASPLTLMSGKSLCTSSG